MNNIEDIINLLGNFGFPIVISLYLLIRLETKMEKLDDTIGTLAKVIEKLCTIKDN